MMKYCRAMHEPIVIWLWERHGRVWWSYLVRPQP